MYPGGGGGGARSTVSAHKLHLFVGRVCTTASFFHTSAFSAIFVRRDAETWNFKKVISCLFLSIQQQQQQQHHHHRIHCQSAHGVTSAHADKLCYDAMASDQRSTAPMSVGFSIVADDWGQVQLACRGWQGFAKPLKACWQSALLGGAWIVGSWVKSGVGLQSL